MVVGGKVDKNSDFFGIPEIFEVINVTREKKVYQVSGSGPTWERSAAKIKENETKNAKIAFKLAEDSSPLKVLQSF